MIEIWYFLSKLCNVCIPCVIYWISYICNSCIIANHWEFILTNLQQVKGYSMVIIQNTLVSEEGLEKQIGVKGERVILLEYIWSVKRV